MSLEEAVPQWPQGEAVGEEGENVEVSGGGADPEGTTTLVENPTAQSGKNLPSNYEQVIPYEDRLPPAA